MMPTDAQFGEMWDAICDGDCKKLDALIRAGFGVDTRVEGDEWNLLHMACVAITTQPDPDVIRHLIALGVDVNARDNSMWTPLHFAARTQNSRVVKLLIDAGAEIDAMNDEGITPLHQCLLERPCNLEVVEMLLAAGAEGGGAVRKFVNAVSAPDIPAIRALLEKYAKKKTKQAAGDRAWRPATRQRARKRISGKHMKYFYFDASSRTGVQSESAVEGDAEEITATWNSLPRVAGSFFGIYSSTGVVVQFMWKDLNSIAIDLPFPSRGGSMAKQSSFEECNAVIANVCNGGDPQGIPGLEFLQW